MKVDLTTQAVKDRRDYVFNLDRDNRDILLGWLLFDLVRDERTAEIIDDFREFRALTEG